MIDYEYEKKYLKSVVGDEYYNRQLETLEHNSAMINDLLVFMTGLVGREEDGVSFDKSKFLIIQSKLKFIDYEWDALLRRMKAKIKTGDIEGSMEDLDTSIFLVKHIKEKEKTSLKNIF